MPRWLQIRYTTLYETIRFVCLRTSRFDSPTLRRKLLRLRGGKPPKRRTQTATLSNTLHYIDRTETSPPVSKLFGADTGGIKNPPYDSNYTGKSGAVKGKTSGTSSALDSTQLATAPKKKIINRQKNNKEQNIIRKKVLTN